MDTGRRPTTSSPLKRTGLTAFTPLRSLAFLAGLLVIYVQPTLPSMASLLLLLPVILLIWYWNRPIAMLLMVLLLGVSWMIWIAQQRQDARWPESRHGENVWVQGVVSDIPERNGSQWRFYFESDDFPGRIRVSWYRSSEELRVGQCWRLLLRMRTPRGSVNPGAFDYEGWLFRKGIMATAYVREGEPCDIRMTGINFSVLRWRQKWVDAINETLVAHPMRGVVLALVFGVRDDFSQSDWDILRRTGTSHLMAISGLHVGIIAGWFYLIGYWLWRTHTKFLNRVAAPRAALLFSISGAVVYVLLSGSGLPAQRALIMLLAFSWAIWKSRKSSVMQVLAIALMVILLLDPFAIASAGFWLSFGALAWIFYLLTYRWKMPGKIAGFVRLQFYLCLALSPITFYWFAEASWIAPLVNLLLIPVFSCLVPLVFIAALLAIAWPPTGLALVFVADALELVWQALGWIDSSVYAAVSMPAVQLWACVLASIGLLWFCSPQGWPARSSGLLLCLPLFGATVGESSKNIPQSTFQLTVLDVGQGLSVVVETAEHVLVYDAGPAYSGGFDSGAMIVLPYLRYAGHKNVDALVQSHGDLDHRGGMAAIMRGMPIGRRFGFNDNTPCRRGMQWQWDAVNFEFLHPDADSWQGNDSSCVLRINAGEYSALLTGDIEKKVEYQLLNQNESFKDKLQANVLVVPHHGSASSSTGAFLKAVFPQISIFSAGWRNRWGFPKDDVLNRYKSQGSTVYSTAQHGAVQMRISALEGVSQAITWRQHDHRFWRAHADEAWLKNTTD